MVVGIGRVVPLHSENRASDLLAVLIENDPHTAAGVFGLGDVAGREVTVAREVGVGGRDRVDLLIWVDGHLRTVVEIEMLSGLGLRQLDRYSESYPGACTYLLLHPGQLALELQPDSVWDRVTWEAVLHAFASSEVTWVAQTATAWREYFVQAMPAPMQATTRWNSFQEGELFAVSMQMKMSWVYGHLESVPPVVSDLVQSGAGRSWVARLYAPAIKPGYVVAAEVEENTPRSWPMFASSADAPLTGPKVWIGLRQGGVQTSAEFDWEYLLRMWPVMSQTFNDWATNRPALRSKIDKDAWTRVGSPPGLGFGFGDREAVRSGTVMFGAKRRLPVDVTLGDVVKQLQATADLVRRMSVVE